MFTRQSLLVFFVSLLLLFVTYTYLHSVTAIDPAVIKKEPQYAFNYKSENITATSTPTRFQTSPLQQNHRQHSGTEITGLTDIVGSGICIVDLNNDRYQDVIYIAGTGQNRDYGKVAFWTNYSSSVRVLINNNGKELVDKTPHWLKQGSLMDMGCTTADFNNDGYIDVVITGSNGAEILENIHGREFSPHQLVSDSPFWGTSVSAVDINNDNKLDIYLSTFVKYKNWSKSKESNAGFELETSPNFEPKVHNAQKNKIFLNHGDFDFKESHDYTKTIGSEDIRSLDHLWYDFNSDGLDDLYVTSLSGSASKLFLRSKDGSFVKDSNMYPLLELNGVLSVTLSDLNRDGIQELIINRDSANLSLIYQLKNGKIKNVTSQYLSAPERLHSSYSSVVINDRYNSDLILFANGTTQLDKLRPRETVGQRNVLLTNTGSIKLSTKASSRGTATVDINNDGAIEVLLNNNNSFLEITEQIPSNTTDIKWVGLEFIGNPKDNITVEYNSETYRAPSKQGYLSNSDKRIIIKHALAGEELLIKSSDQALSVKLTDEILNSYLLVKVRPKIELIDTYKSTKLEVATKIKEIASNLNSNDLQISLSALDYIKKTEAEELFHLVDHTLQQNIDSNVYCKIANVLSHFYQEEEAGINNKYKLVRTLISNADKLESGIKLSCTLHALGKSETTLAALFITDKLLNTQPDHTSYLWVRALRDTKEIKSPIKIYNKLKSVDDYKLILELLLLVIDSGVENQIPHEKMLNDITNERLKNEVVSYLYHLYPTYHKKLSANYQIGSSTIIPLEELLLTRKLSNLSVNDFSVEELNTFSKQHIKNKRNAELLLDLCTKHLVMPGNYILSLNINKKSLRKSLNICVLRSDSSPLATKILSNYQSILDNTVKEYLEGIVKHEKSQ